jgi:hypothetical protein
LAQVAIRCGRTDLPGLSAREPDLCTQMPILVALGPAGDLPLTTLVEALALVRALYGVLAGAVDSRRGVSRRRWQRPEAGGVDPSAHRWGEQNTPPLVRITEVELHG